MAIDAEAIAQADRVHDSVHKAHDSTTKQNCALALAECIKMTKILREEVEHGKLE